MTDQQLYMAIGIPLLFNGICFTAVFMMLSWLNTKIDNLDKRLSDRIDKLEYNKIIH